MNILAQNLVLLKDREEKFFGLKKGFEFLDLFLDSCEKLKKEKSNVNGNFIEVTDYRTNEKLYFDPIEIQNIYTTTYNNFLHENYFCGFFIYEKICYSVSEVLKEFNLGDQEMLMLQVIVRNILFCFYIIPENSFSEQLLKNNFYQRFLIFLEKDGSLELSNVIYDVLKNKSILIEINKEKLKFSDDYFFWHLKFMTLNVVKIFPESNFDISYSSVYCFNNLINTIVNFLNSRDKNIISELKSKLTIKSDIEFIEFIYNNYNSLDTYTYELKSFDVVAKNLFFKLFIDKISINSYCFHAISICCFDKYYLSNIPNILFDKTPSLRLNY